MNQFVNYWSSRRRRAGEGENLFKEIMVENIPNLGIELDNQVHEVHRSPNTIKLETLQTTL